MTEKKSKKGCFLALFLICGIGLAVVLGLYFALTSTMGFRVIVKPILEKTLEREVSASSVRVSPFGKVAFENLEISPNPGDSAPSLKLDHFLLRFRLLGLLQRKLHIRQCEVQNLQVRLHVNAKGVPQGPFPPQQPKTSTPPSERPAPSHQEKAPVQTGPPEKSSKPPMEILLENIDISQVSLRITQEKADQQSPNVIEIKDLSLQSKKFILGETSDINLSALLQATLHNENSPKPLELATRLQARSSILTQGDTVEKAETSLTLSETKGQLPQVNLDGYRLELKSANAQDGPFWTFPTSLKIFQHDKELAFLELSGKMNPQTQSGNLNVTLHPVDKAVLNLLGASQGMNFQDTRVQAELKLELEKSKPQSLNLKTRVADMNPTGPMLPKGGFPATQIAVDVNGKKDGNDFLLNLMDVKIDQDGKNLVTSQLVQPLRLDPETFQPRGSGGETENLLSLHIPGLNLPLWQSLFAPQSPAKLEKGLLQARLTLGTALSTTNPPFTVSGNVNFQNVQVLQPDNKRLGPLTANTQMDLRLQPEELLEIRQWTTQLKFNQENIGNIQIDGKIQPGPQPSGQVRCTIPTLRLTPLFTVLQIPAPEQFDFSQAELELHENLKLSPGKTKPTLQIDGKGALKYLATPSSYKGKRETLQVQLENSLKLEDPAIAIDKCVIRMQTSAGKAGTINTNGGINPKSSEPPALTIQSDSLDLKKLLPFAGITPAQDGAPLKLENLKTLIVLKDKILEVQDFSTQLAQGSITFPLFRQTSQATGPAKMEWQQIQAEGVDMDTLIANFAPKWRGTLLAKGNLFTEGQAQGFTEKAMADHLRIKFEANLSDGEILNLPVLNEIATVTGLKELKKVLFTRAECKMESDEKGFDIQRIYIKGKHQKMQLDGRVDYNQRMDLPLKLALGADLKKEVQKNEYSRFLKEDEEGYLVFPAPIGIGGTTAKPRVKLSFPKDAIKETIKESVVDTGLNLLKNELEKR